MSDDTARSTRGTGHTVVDPGLRVWQRRYFHQPPTGRGRRAVTARRAELGWPLPAPVLAVLARWDAARDRATAARGPARWV